ncbi:MAG TPA: hypothetical protein DD457_02110 [Gammaproteobacteria bacterium]|nr:hypothetical protein [Gammaproteobacteria bacterium]
MSIEESWPMDSQKFREGMSQFATGVVVVTGIESGSLVGFAAQSFVSLSLEPPLVSISPQIASTSWPRIREGRNFCINILGEGQDNVSEAFAVVGEVAAIGWQPSGASGMPVLEGSIAHIDCRLRTEHEAGDHTIVIADVVDLEVHDQTSRPLVYFRGSYGGFSSD